MNILREYTLDYVRCNKKSSAAIIIAILIATTLLSALSGFLYTMYTDEIRLAILENGHWHAEMYDNTAGEKLKFVTGHPNVAAVMIKGTWKAAKIDDPRRPYLVMRDLTENYWASMREQYLIMEGRIPQSQNELAISKQYFEHHPELEIGDSIRLSTGDRIFNKEKLEPRDLFKEGELFVPKEEQIYTVVGKLDIATNSSTPAYIAYGFMNESSIQPDDQLTVYIRFSNPGAVYKDTIQIAKSVGFIPDEYGNYMVRMNTGLLAKYFIFSPEQIKDFDIWQFSQPLMFVAISFLVVGVFVFIINNAFAMSANARLKQLGMLQSIGASPKQIRHSVVFESLILSAIPIPAGLFIGWLLDFSFFTYINTMDNLRPYSSEIVYTFGLPATLLSVLMSLLTVWLSALLPTRKIARLSPIEAIRQSSGLKIKGLKKHPIINRIFGIEGELAQNALSARRKSYRTAASSLTLSFLLLSVFLNLLAINDTQLFIYEKSKNGDTYVSVSIQDGNMTDPELEDQLRSINDIKAVLFLSYIPASLWLTEDKESKEFNAIGGFTHIAGRSKYSVYEDNGKFCIRTNLITLDDKSFAEYCTQIGADVVEFYNAGSYRTIVVNKQKDDINSTRRNELYLPFLGIKAGDILVCEEKIYLEDTADFHFQTEIGFITDQMPILSDIFDGYQLAQIMPRSTYLKIVNHFEEARSVRAHYVTCPVAVQSKNSIHQVARNIQEICDNWYGSGDYTIWNMLEVRQASEKGRNLLKVVLLCVSVFLAFIGISNVFSTVSGNLRQRQKEFTLLRSVGISPGGIKRILMFEALFFGLLPIVLSIPFNVLLIWVFLKMISIYISEFIPFMPVLPITAFGAMIMLSVLLAYSLGRRMLLKDNISDILKDDTV